MRERFEAALKNGGLRKFEATWSAESYRSRRRATLPPCSSALILPPISSVDESIFTICSGSTASGRSRTRPPPTAAGRVAYLFDSLPAGGTRPTDHASLAAYPLPLGEMAERIAYCWTGDPKLRRAAARLIHAMSEGAKLEPQKAPRCRNWRTAMTVAFPPCAARRGPRQHRHGSAGGHRPSMSAEMTAGRSPTTMLS
jgi:hypothetical protein